MAKKSAKGSKKKKNKEKKGKSPDADDEDEDEGEGDDDEDEDDSDEDEDEDESPKSKKKKGKKSKSEDEDEDDSDEDEDEEEGEGDEDEEEEEEEEEEKSPKKKKKKDEDEEEEEEEEDDDEDEDENGEEQEEIDPETYKPRASSTPVPPGVEDCFGKFHDPDVHECKNCLESANCRLVMKANKEKAGEGKKKKKKHDREEPAEEKSEKKTTGMSDALTAIMAKSRYKKFGGELKQRGKKPLFFLSLGGKRFLRLAKANREEGFVVRILTRLKPISIGMKSADWKQVTEGKHEFKGNVKFLGKKLRIIFRKAKAKMGADEE